MYSRYSTNDWDSSNKANFNLSERERSLAERLRADAWRAVKATDTRTRNRQTSNTKRLSKFILKNHGEASDRIRNLTFFNKTDLKGDMNN